MILPFIIAASALVCISVGLWAHFHYDIWNEPPQWVHSIQDFSLAVAVVLLIIFLVGLL